MLDELVTEQRAVILDRWLERILCDYPQEGSTFLREQQDRFANPVGHTLRSELGGVLDGVLGSPTWPEVREALDRILRIRAVQEMPPSRAVGFILGLKAVIRDALGEGASAVDRGAALAELDRRVDVLVLAAFDVYSACREQLCSIRVNEIRNRSLKTMERLHAWQQARAAGRAANRRDRE